VYRVDNGKVAGGRDQLQALCHSRDKTQKLMVEVHEALKEHATSFEGARDNVMNRRIAENKQKLTLFNMARTSSKKLLRDVSALADELASLYDGAMFMWDDRAYALQAREMLRVVASWASLAVELREKAIALYAAEEGRKSTPGALTDVRVDRLSAGVADLPKHFMRWPPLDDADSDVDSDTFKEDRVGKWARMSFGSDSDLEHDVEMARRKRDEAELELLDATRRHEEARRQKEGGDE
jgi:hypothetical protein